jgi:hypothetical protein
MGRSIQINTTSLDSFEGLHQAIRGSHVEVTQLGRGKFRGSLSHVGIGDFSLSIGSFSVGVRTQRIATDDRLVIGMLLSASERVTHWSFDMLPGDVLIMPPSTEHDGSFHGAAAYAAIRLDLAEVTSLFAGEPRLSDPATWCQKNRYRADSLTGLIATQRIRQIVPCLARQQAGISDEVADFWKRSIIDATAATIIDALPAENRAPVPQAMQLVRNVEHYRHGGLPAGAHFGNLRPVQRLAAQPAPGVLRHAGFGTGHLPPPQAALRDPLRATAKHPRHRHHRRDRHATRLHRTRPLLALLPIAVRGVPVGDAARVETHFARNRPPEGSRHRMISRGAAPFGSETRNCIAVPPTERRLCNVECPLLNLDICRRDDRPQTRVHGAGMSWADMPETTCCLSMVVPPLSLTLHKYWSRSP